MTHRLRRAVIGRMEPVETSPTPQPSSLKAKVAARVTGVVFAAYFGAFVWHRLYNGPEWLTNALLVASLSAFWGFRAIGWTPKRPPRSIALTMALWAVLVALFFGFWQYQSHHR